MRYPAEQEFTLDHDAEQVRRLLAAAEALVNQSVTPPAVDHPEAYAVRGGGVFLPDGADWLEATAELRKAFVHHPELDPSVAGG